MESIVRFLKNPIFLFIIFFFYGSILFGYILSKVFFKKDIRKYGDGNPGTWNAFKVGGAKIGIPTLLLDYSKGLIPSIIAKNLYSQNSFYFIILSIAPILGHAFSPFLKFKGGKAMASSFGLWTALTLWEGPTLMGATTLISCSIQDNSAICSILGFASLLFLLVLRDYPKEFLIIYLINLIIVFIKLRKDLFLRPKFRLRNPFKS